MSDLSRNPTSERLDSLIERIGVVPLASILEELLKRAATTLNVERVGYWSLEDDRTGIRRRVQYLLSNDGFDTDGLVLKANDFPMYFAALHEGSSLVVADDTMADPRLAEFHEAYFKPLGIGAMLDAPVHRQGRLYGVICHEHVGPQRVWTETEVDFARYVAQWIALALEIEERQRAETALRESEERYRLVIDHAPTPTVVVDLQSGLFADANWSAAKFFGVDRETLLGGGPADFSPDFQPDGRASTESAREKISQAIESGSQKFDWVHRAADGREIPCSVHLAKMPGSGLRVIAAVTDLTEQLRTEETMRRALENERELNELRSRFTSIVSHEFRTPLGVIMSAVELLRNYHDRLDAARRGELHDDIRTATRRMADLMEQVLVLGRADAGKLSFTPAPVDLQVLCAKLTDESLSATVRRCPVRTDIANDLSGARADEPLLRHIFSNLLSNAAKYSPPGSPVEFTIRREGTDAVFTVTDHGIGIPREDQPRMFEAFQRGGNVGEIQGSGLGLLITKRCVELHQGEISFVSGTGTTFTVRLPVFG
jgi:PAS domain S-box-containing protein